MSRFNDLSNQQFGKLTARWPVGKRGEKVIWLVSCECGTLKLVSTSDLVTKHSISCGCSKVDRFYKPGMSRTAEADIYYGARARCNNPKIKGYEYYGGRGIKFLFTSFEKFFAELGERPDGMSIDRINTNGHYEPGNVRWATQSEQVRNSNPPRKRGNWSEKARSAHMLEISRRKGRG